jgi:transcriptional regulator NrdR family protein
MPITPADVEAFIEVVLAELRSSKPPAVRIARVGTLLAEAERKLDNRAALQPRSRGRGF